MSLKYFFSLGQRGRCLLAVLLSFSIMTGSKAQIGQGGQPPSFTYPTLQANLQRNSIPSHQLPALNNQQLLREAETQRKQECGSCEKLYWGKGIDVDINLRQEAQYYPHLNGSVGVFKIISPNAKGLQLKFDRFQLPPGAKLFIYNQNRSQVLGSFTEANNRSDQRLAFQPLPSDTLIIEFYIPSNNNRTDPYLHIGRIIHDFRGILTESGPYGNSGDCNVDANCLSPPQFEHQISATGLIITNACGGGLTALCTGALLNNTAQDGTPYFLTAGHCIDSCSSGWYEGPDSWTFLFNHETPQCQDNDGEAYMGQSISGASILSAGPSTTSSSDYGLLKLDRSPPPSYNVCYAGWDRSGNTPDEVRCFHHPSGDVKKGNYDPSPYPYFITASGFNFGNNYWMAIWPQFDGEGVTESGSSGSPLFDQDQRVIGQLYGGDNNDCAVLPDTSGYGKFSVSWNQGNFGQWLDPLNKGDTLINAYCPVSRCDSLIRLTDRSGTFSDGSNDSDYVNTANCRWLIHPPGNRAIKVTFNSLIIQKSEDDSIYVFDGASEKDSLLFQFAGFQGETTLHSKNDTVYVQFISDTGGTSLGWDAKYCVKPELTIHKGEDTICSWYNDSAQLSANGGEQIQWEPEKGLSCTKCDSPIASPKETTTYQAIATNGQKCRDTNSITVNVRECIPPEDTIGLGEVRIFPNPNRGQFQISLSVVQRTDFSIHLYDMAGRLMLLDDRTNYRGLYSKTVTLPPTYKGLYVLQFQTEEGVLNKKLVLQ